MDATGEHLKDERNKQNEVNNSKEILSSKKKKKKKKENLRKLLNFSKFVIVTHSCEWSLHYETLVTGTHPASLRMDGNSPKSG